MTTTTTKEKYFEGVGRRKTATARVRLTKAGKDSFVVNGKSLDDYFPTAEMRERVKKALAKIGEHGAYDITVKIAGGGISAHADALIMGLGRAIIKIKPEIKPEIKKEKMLTRDAREKERRKFGLKKARKAPQWSKR
jgi:small subunit ribosomal protein S9